ncbi:MAG: YebC/PmpR family DNA-binding transcriptional regulator [bacterium]|nr:YebC/PmpR family DNA-binding transcriptional regulator [bacterium]
MSGHSHWATIKRKKADTDAKKSKEFSKMTREISVSVRQGGPDPLGNIRLRMALDRARELNIPATTIERAVKKGEGKDPADRFEEILLEARGQEGVALLLEGITNNKNRTIGEMRTLLEKNGAKLVEEGAMRWLFDRKGVVVVTLSPSHSKEDIALRAIEAGAQDMREEEGALLFYSNPTDLELVRQAMKACKVSIETSFLEWVPKDTISLKEGDTLQNLIDLLEEHEDIQRVFHNAF